MLKYFLLLVFAFATTLSAQVVQSGKPAPALIRTVSKADKVFPGEAQANTKETAEAQADSSAKAKIFEIIDQRAANCNGRPAERPLNVGSRTFRVYQQGDDGPYKVTVTILLTPRDLVALSESVTSIQPADKQAAFKSCWNQQEI